MLVWQHRLILGISMAVVAPVIRKLQRTRASMDGQQRALVLRRGYNHFVGCDPQLLAGVKLFELRRCMRGFYFARRSSF